MTDSVILIIGAGRLGTSLYRVLKEFNHPTVYLVGKKSYRPSEFIAETNYSSKLSQQLLNKVSTIFICVQDEKISAIVSELLKFDLNSKIILHTSGSTGLDVFKGLNDKKVFKGSLHPLQTFPDHYTNPANWKNIYCSFEGDNKALGVSDKICKLISAKLIKLNYQQKMALHIAAVYASNFVVSLLDESDTLIKNADINIPANKLLNPLLSALVENYKSSAAKNILSGPIIRGDTNIISKHLHYLKDNKESFNFYISLANKIVNNRKFNIKNREKLKQTIDKNGIN